MPGNIVAGFLIVLLCRLSQGHLTDTSTLPQNHTVYNNTMEMRDILGMSLSRHRLQALLHGTGLVKSSDTTILCRYACKCFRPQVKHANVQTCIYKLWVVECRFRLNGKQQSKQLQQLYRASLECLSSLTDGTSLITQIPL